MSDIQEWLDKGHALANQATQGPWEADGCEVTQHWSRPEPWQTIVDTEVSCMDFCYGGSAKGVERDEDAEFIADARTRLPKALDALQAVLDTHRPSTADTGEEEILFCPECFDVEDVGEADTWPCPTVQAIQDAIGDKQ